MGIGAVQVFFYLPEVGVRILRGSVDGLNERRIIARVRQLLPKSPRSFEPEQAVEGEPIVLDVALGGILVVDEVPEQVAVVFV